MAIGHRRTLTATAMPRCIEGVDQLKEAGRPAKELASSEANLSQGKSSEQTAKVAGVSTRKVTTAKVDQAEQVAAGKITLPGGAGGLHLLVGVLATASAYCSLELSIEIITYL